MSKVSFRARTLDAAKPMPVFHAEDIPDLSEYASIGRSVVHLPSGMEKEEENELHLQQVISARQVQPGVSANSEPCDDVVIPIPRFADVIKSDELGGKRNFRLSKSYIKHQATLNLEPEQPDYDLDSDDELWIDRNRARYELTALQFERMIDVLEKQSEHQVLRSEEAKLALRDEDDDLVMAVYDYWLNKRLQTKHALCPRVRNADRRDGTASSSNPYLAFRRRAEKIQTRKNRKNDEESYEKMLKIRRDLKKAVTLLEMICRREKSKREVILLNQDILERRLTLQDWTDSIYNQIQSSVKPQFQFSKDEMLLHRRFRRAENKRRRLGTVTGNAARIDVDSSRASAQDIISREWLEKVTEDWHRPSTFPGSSIRLPDDSKPMVSRLDDAKEDADGRYGFKRRRGCSYFQPVDEHSYSQSHCAWEHPVASTSAAAFNCATPCSLLRCRYRPVALHTPSQSVSAGALRFVGLARRRMARGGRIALDRACFADKSGSVFQSVSTSAARNLSSAIFRPNSPVCFELGDDLERVAADDAACNAGTCSHAAVENSAKCFDCALSAAARASPAARDKLSTWSSFVSRQRSGFDAAPRTFDYNRNSAAEDRAGGSVSAAPRSSSPCALLAWHCSNKSVQLSVGMPEHLLHLHELQLNEWQTQQLAANCSSPVATAARSSLSCVLGADDISQATASVLSPGWLDACGSGRLAAPVAREPAAALSARGHRQGTTLAASTASTAPPALHNLDKLSQFHGGLVLPAASAAASIHNYSKLSNGYPLHGSALLSAPLMQHGSKEYCAVESLPTPSPSPQSPPGLHQNSFCSHRGSARLLDVATLSDTGSPRSLSPAIPHSPHKLQPPLNCLKPLSEAARAAYVNATSPAVNGECQNASAVH